MAWVGRCLGPSPVVPVRVIRAALPDCCGTLPRGVVLWCGVPRRGIYSGAPLPMAAPWGYRGHVPPLFQNAPPNVPPRTPGFRHTSAHLYALVKAASHRGKEKGRTVMEPYGLICGARGRNRTHRRKRTMRNFVRNHRACFLVCLCSQALKSSRFQRLHFCDSATAGRGKSGRFTNLSRV